MEILGIFFFTLSIIGYSDIFRLLRFNKYFTWITGILFQVLILYIFAMLNFLKFGIWIVTSVGFILCISRLILGYLGKVSIHHEGLHLYDIWMLFFGLVMAIVLLHSPLIHYDNFSHWATIVKFLHYTGHLPEAKDTIISFTSYPPATALFITQFITFTGFKEGNMLVAQFILIWAATYTIFSTLRDRTRGLNSMLLCLTIAISYVFNINIRLNNLLVDYVLAIITLAALVGIYIYKDKMLLLNTHVAIFTGFLLLVKNSAIFFVIIIICYYLHILIRQTNFTNKIKAIMTLIKNSVMTMLISFLPFIWWEFHVHTSFKSSKHEINAAAYKSQLSKDGMDGFIGIGKAFIHHIFNITSLSTEGILIINIGLIVSYCLIKYLLHHQNVLLKILILLDLVIILYYISLLGMYVLSMPFAEAITLDGFERYMSSIVILSLFIGMIFLVYTIDKTYYEQNIKKRSPRNYSSIWTKNGYQLATFLIMFFSVIMMYSEINGTIFTNNYNRKSLPVSLNRVADPWTKVNNTKILIVDSNLAEVNTYYAGYLANYYFFTNNATGQAKFSKSEKEFKKDLNKYEYIVIPKYDKKFSRRIRKFYHQNIKTGFYKNQNSRFKSIKKLNKG